MRQTVEAIYENGVLKPVEAVDLPERIKVKMTIETDAERAARLKDSEESLKKTWDNAGDDVFNELLIR
jgi:predicted DNA-binding antitoxin AbrB/MazE fold protein